MHRIFRRLLLPTIGFTSTSLIAHTDEHPRLQPPKTLTDVVPSRRNPCFGFGIVIDVAQFNQHHTMLKNIQQEVIDDIKPGHKSPDFIKVKSLHAAFFGNVPFTTPAGYAQFFADPEKLNNGLFLDNLEMTLGHYLYERVPRLIPVSLELNRNDGSIMARFAFLDNQEENLVYLKNQLDPEKKMGMWDPNPARNNSVTVVLCSCTDKEKFDDIQAILDKHNTAFKALEPVSINHCTLAEYDKRTWTRGCNLHVIAEKPTVEKILHADLGKKSGLFIENTANASPYYFDSERQTLTALTILPPYRKAFDNFMADKTTPQKCHLAYKELEKMQRWAGLGSNDISQKHLKNTREIYANPPSNVCSRH